MARKTVEDDMLLKPAVYLAALLGLRREEICGFVCFSGRVNFWNTLLEDEKRLTFCGPFWHVHRYIFGFMKDIGNVKVVRWFLFHLCCY